MSERDILFTVTKIMLKMTMERW